MATAPIVRSSSGGSGWVKAKWTAYVRCQDGKEIHEPKGFKIETPSMMGFQDNEEAHCRFRQTIERFNRKRLGLHREALSA